MPRAQGVQSRDAGTWLPSLCDLPLAFAEMDDEDHMVYSDEFEPSTLDHARRKLLNDFEKVRNPGCTKWQAKRKYAAERYLAHVDELLKVRR